MSPLYTILYNCASSRNTIPRSHMLLALRVAFRDSPARRPPLAQDTGGPSLNRLRRTFSAGALPGAPTASGLLLAPPRAMRCEPALCGSGEKPTSSAPLPWRITNDGLLTSPIATATLPPPPQAHEFPARPAGSARQRFAHIHRNSASDSRCRAPILLLSLLRSAAARVPPLSSANLAVADSPLFASRHSAGRCCRWPVQSVDKEVTIYNNTTTTVAIFHRIRETSIMT